MVAGGSSISYSAGGLVSYGYTNAYRATQYSGGSFGKAAFGSSSLGAGGGYYSGHPFSNGGTGGGGSSFISGHAG